MFIPALKLVSKAATIIAIVNTGYKTYKKGAVVYSVYKKTKKAKEIASKVMKQVKIVVKKK